MKYEYLLFNIIVISGPFIFGMMKPFYFLNHWKNAALAIIAAAVPFLIWDELVTNRHWFFNPDYTIGIKIFQLPFEEVLFFITVPYACLFTWEMVFRRTSNKKIIRYGAIFYIASGFIIAGGIAWGFGKEYTGLALIAFGLSMIYDERFGAQIFSFKRFYIFWAIVALFTLIFNGYLTWRPVVTYDEIYQIGFRIFTIPVEDFFFGFALLILATSTFEKLRSSTLRQ